MLTFKQWLFEMAYHSTSPQKNFMGLSFNTEIFKNPNRKEIKDVSSHYNDSKAIFYGDHVYMWNAEASHHGEIADHLERLHGENPHHAVLAIVDHPSKSVHVWGYKSKERLPNNHPWVKKHGYKVTT